ARLFVDRGRWVLKVVRADDGGVAAGIAAAEPALLDDRDIGDAEVLAEIVGGGEAVAAGADDQHVVFPLRLGRGPGAFPTLMVAHRLAHDGEDGIAFQAHANPPWSSLRGVPKL